MTKPLQFLERCVQNNISIGDIGLLSKWLFKLGYDVNGIDDKYFEKVQKYLDVKVFDDNILIQLILDTYTT